MSVQVDRLGEGFGEAVAAIEDGVEVIQLHQTAIKEIPLPVQIEAVSVSRAVAMVTSPAFTGLSEVRLHALFVPFRVGKIQSVRRTVKDGHPSEVSEIDGPSGLRTDNARFEFQYFAGTGRARSGDRCEPGPGD